MKFKIPNRTNRANNLKKNKINKRFLIHTDFRSIRINTYNTNY